MKKNYHMVPKKYLYVAISGLAIVAIAIAVIQFVIPMTSQDGTSNQVAFLDFSYEEENSDLKSNLALHHINMTNPITLSSPSDIKQYCDFINDPQKQALVTHCTSTVLKDKLGTLGDIDMVGSPDVPGLVVVALELDPTMSDYASMKTVFGVVINSTICQCWSPQNPGGYSNLSDMVDALRTFHVNGKEPNSTTHTVALGNKHFEIELTTNDGGYLWKLLVAK
jgi:hypothetical protein